MLSSNSAEKLSGPWLFFWIFVILGIFLGPPFVWGGFVFYGFFGAPGKVAKRFLRFCMVFLGPLVRWQKYFKTFFSMPGYLPDMGF